MKKLQTTHLVNQSPWPILGAMSALMVMMSMIMMMNKSNYSMIITASSFSMITFFLWSKDIFSESSMEGQHSKKTSLNLKMGMVLFIISEIFLFISMFWMFFHSSLSPSVEISMKWPPHYIKTFNYEEMPLLNTIILVSSGATLTLAHHLLMKKNLNLSIIMMIMTITLGIMFTTMQMTEYMSSKFSINDSVYGSSFFLTTGLHGAHVIIGTTFLMTVTLQMKNMKSMPHQFISFEMAAWYWHFVDVVWLFLLMSIYWWGS